jgi:hypothetical protein
MPKNTETYVFYASLTHFRLFASSCEHKNSLAKNHGNSAIFARSIFDARKLRGRIAEGRIGSIHGYARLDRAHDLTSQKSEKAKLGISSPPIHNI